MGDALTRGFENREQGRGCFFAWDGGVITRPESERFFEVPIELLLPEDLNFIPSGRVMGELNQQTARRLSSELSLIS